MFRTRVLLCVFLLTVIPICAQQPITAANGSSTVVVPPMVSFSGALTDVNGKPLTGVVGVTFALYQDQQGGTPLWLETQNIYPDKTGHYTVMLGSTTSTGIPSQIFVTGEARWLGVQPQGQPEQPRVSVLSVPYAMQAANAQTVGGLPASAFVLAAPPSSTSTSTASAGAVPQPLATGTTPVTTAGGTVNQVPLWDSTSDITSSVITQTGSGSTAKVGINTTTPATTLDVKGNGTIRGTLFTGTVGVGTTTPTQKLEVDLGNAIVKGPGNFTKTGDTAFVYLGDTSHPLEAIWGSGLAIGTYKVPQALFIQDATGDVGIGTPTPAYTLDVQGTGNFTGLVNFASGQTFPGAGTIAGVTAGTGLSGGGTSGTVTLTNTGILGVTAGTGISSTGGQTPTISINTSVVPQLAAANTFTGNQTVNGNVSATGVVTGSSYQIGSNLFAFGTYAISNVSLGFAGNTTMTGFDNTAVGARALYSNQGGFANTAYGLEALYSNTSGAGNIAIGEQALYYNVAGNANTALGNGALQYNVGDSAGDGGGNTALGGGALWQNNDTSGTGLYALDNTGVGGGALLFNTTGSKNTAVGLDALMDSITGNWNTGVGYGADVANSSPSNSTVIGAYAYTSQSNTLVLGCNTTSSDQCPANVSVGIGTSTPDNLLTVNGTADKPGGGSWGTYSDRRLKTLDGSFNSGLSQIMKLHPVRYHYNKDNALRIQDEQQHVGLVAQDVQKIIPEAVTENSKGYLLLDNDPILWSMLNAIKEQQRMIRQQQEQIRTQQAQIARLSSQVKAIQATLKTGRQNEPEVRTAKATSTIHQ